MWKMTLFDNLFQLQHINKWYQNATFSEAFEFKFANGEIQLGLEKEQVKDSWTIFPRSYPCIVCSKIFYLYGCMACAMKISSLCMQWLLIYHTVSNSHQLLRAIPCSMQWFLIYPIVLNSRWSWINARVLVYVSIVYSPSTNIYRI